MVPPDPETAPSREFDDALQELRQQGCTILVANDRDVETSKAVARVLLGSPDERRYRVLAFDETPSARKVAGFLPEGVAVDDEAVAVVTNGSSARSAGPAARSRLGPVGTGSGRRDDDLQAFARETGDTVDDLGTRFGSFEPGELRVAAFDLAGLAGRYTVRGVRRYCRVVGQRVRDRRGTAYFFVGASTEDRLVDDLARQVDARIDVGRRDGDLVQRWHVPARGDATDWVAMERPE